MVGVFLCAHRNSRRHRNILMTQMHNHVWTVQSRIVDFRMQDCYRRCHVALHYGMVVLQNASLGLNNIPLAGIGVLAGGMGDVLADCSNQGT